MVGTNDDATTSIPCGAGTGTVTCTGAGTGAAVVDGTGVADGTSVVADGTSVVADTGYGCRYGCSRC